MTLFNKKFFHSCDKLTTFVFVIFHSNDVTRRCLFFYTLNYFRTDTNEFSLVLTQCRAPVKMTCLLKNLPITARQMIYDRILPSKNTSLFKHPALRALPRPSAPVSLALAASFQFLTYTDTSSFNWLCIGKRIEEMVFDAWVFILLTWYTKYEYIFS